METAHKTCKKCGEVKPLDMFPLCKGKHRARCKPCHSADAMLWAKKNKEKYKARLRQWNIKNNKPVFMGPPLPKEVKAARKLAYAQSIAPRMREHRKKWESKNKHAVIAKTRAYQARKITALPSWADLEQIKKIYLFRDLMQKERGIEMEVDHIVPLQSKSVCGLHVQANLQVIPKSENRKKANRRWPDMP